jgi:hypothetical protein
MQWNTQEQLQKHFFNHLVQMRGMEQVLDGTMQALHIMKAAAYKRMNGTTALTSYEMIILAQYFKFSLDTIFQSDRYYAFEQPFSQKLTTIQFLEQFTEFLKPLSSIEGRSRITYLANDLPIFYYFAHPHILKFLIAVWSHIHDEGQRLIVEETVEPNPQLNQIKQEISSYYHRQPITEIWNSNMLNILYQQILFAISVKAMKNVSSIQLLLDDILSLINKLGETLNPSDTNQRNKKIYLNDFGSYLNTVHFESEQINNTFISYDFPKFIVTWNPDFHRYTKDWIAKIVKRSVPISSEAYQQREIFLNKIERDYKAFESNVKKAVEQFY